MLKYAPSLAGSGSHCLKLIDINYLQEWLWVLEFVEKGEVISDDYKLLPVDLRDIKRLDDIIAFVDVDPRYEHVII